MCIISGIFLHCLGICLLSLLFSIHVFGFCGYACITTPYIQGYSYSVNMQNEMRKQYGDKQYFNSCLCPSILTCKCMDTLWSFSKEKGKGGGGDAYMLVRFETWDVHSFWLQMPFKGFVENWWSSKTSDESNEQCWTD